MQWAPGIQDQRGQIIMQGNALSQRSGEQMAGIANYFMERGNKAKALRQTISAYGGTDEEGDPVYDKAMLDGMNVDELEGHLKGMVLSNAQKEQQARVNEQNARMEQYNAMAEERRDRAAESEAVGRAVNAYSTAQGTEELVPPGALPPGQGALEPGPSGNVSPDSFDFTQPANWGQVVKHPPTPFERMQTALSQPGIGGKTLPATITALSKVQELMAEDPAAQWDTYSVPGAPYMMVSKRGTKQTFQVPLPGAGPLVSDTGREIWTKGHWQELMGDTKGDPTYGTLAQMQKIRESMVTQSEKFTLTKEQKERHDAAIEDWDRQINEVQEFLGDKALKRKGKAGATSAAAAPGETPSGPGVTKGNAAPGKMPTVTTQAQFDALPPGASYIGKGKRVYTKPKA